MQKRAGTRLRPLIYEDIFPAGITGVTG